MKIILIKLVVIIFCTSCALSGRQIIHSPFAEQAIPIRSQHYHGGVTEKSPPNYIFMTFEEKDSVSLMVGAKKLSKKHRWGGIFYPIFPVFFLPRTDYYRDNPNTLTIYMVIGANSEVIVSSDSLRLYVDNQFIKPREVIYQNEVIQTVKIKSRNYEPAPPIFMKPLEYHSNVVTINFPIDANTISEFELSIKGIYALNKPLAIPTVQFIRSEQKWRFAGP